MNERDLYILTARIRRQRPDLSYAAARREAERVADEQRHLRRPYRARTA